MCSSRKPSLVPMHSSSSAVRRPWWTTKETQHRFASHRIASRSAQKTCCYLAPSGTGCAIEKLHAAFFPGHQLGRLVGSVNAGCDLSHEENGVLIPTEEPKLLMVFHG